MSTPRQSVSGAFSVIGGSNDAIDPSLLPDTQFWRGVNVSNRGGLLSTRPGYTKVATLEDGPYQMGFGYRRQTADRFVYVVGGKLFTVNLNDFSQNNLGVLFVNKAPCYFSKPDRYCIAQDDNSTPRVLDGDTLVNPADVRTPTGSISAYGHGRLFTVPKYIPDANGAPTSEDGHAYFIAGDILLPNNSKNIFKITETQYLSGGGAFAMPSDYGPIRAMEFFRNAHTSQDVGSLVVFARDGVAAFAVNQQRSTWPTTDLSTVLFSTSGTESPYSVVPVNDDLFYRGADGLRTIRYTVSNTSSGGGVLSNVPVSSEMKYITDLDANADMFRCTGSFVDNRIHYTSGGRHEDGGFKCMISLDTNTSSTINNQRAQPAYDGIWTGFHVFQTFKGRHADFDREFIVVRRNNANELWMLDEDATDDDGTPIHSRAYFRVMFPSYNGQAKLTAVHNFEYAELWLKDLVGDATITLYWRPDGYPLWMKCNSTTVLADATGLPQHRDMLKFAPENDEDANQVNKEDLRKASSFQFCLDWTGSFRSKLITFNFNPFEPQDDTEVENETERVKIVATDSQVELDDFDYIV